MFYLFVTYLEQEGFAATYACTIPEWVLPHLTLTARRRLCPDGLLIQHARGAIADGIVNIIEFKYTNDCFQQHQQNRADNQHTGLIGELTQVGYKPENIIVHTILLGVSGTIFEKTMASLTKLGVSKPSAITTMTKVHIESVKWLHKIYCTKAHLEQSHNVRHTRRGEG